MSEVALKLPDRYDPILSRERATSVVLSALLCTVVVIGFLILSGQFWHWFIIPVLLCGIVIGIDAVDWLRGRLNILDPVGLLGLLGLHVFFLAPLLHVYWGFWMRYVTPPPDWRGWLGGMAVLNFCGLNIYRLCRDCPLGRVGGTTKRISGQIGPRFPFVLGLAMAVSALLQAWVYQQYGGLSGYVATYEARLWAFRGMGWLFTISESFPILGMMGFAVYARRRKALRNWLVVLPVLLGFFLLQLLFGGLRGSRSNTVYALFWAMGIVHFWVRPWSKKTALVGVGLLVVFMYMYGLYKGAGSRAVAALTSTEDRSALVEETGRTLPRVLLTDLGRADVQAFLLYRLMRPDRDYQYAWGRTYLATALMLVPKSVWPDRPPGKIKEGTEALFGMGTYIPDVFQALRVYGVAGEAMLNFGPLAVPISFVLLGIVVRRVRRWLMVWPAFDPRLLLLPYLINLCWVVLIGDSDNVAFYLIKYGTVPLFVVLLGSKWRVMQETDQETTAT